LSVIHIWNRAVLLNVVLPANASRGVAQVGALAVTVNALALVAEPPGVVTLIGPVVAPAGTAA
jgi:hypothetical protein